MTRQQNWALRAHERVLAKAGTASAGKYRTLCMRGPAILRQAGLVQALPFLETRPGEGKHYAEDLATVVGAKLPELQKRARESSLPQYMALTREVVAAAIWLRRFAQAELQGDDEGVNP